MPIIPRFFYEPEEIFSDVQSRIERAKEAGERIDFLTFVPDGEPTLDIHLGREIVLLKSLAIPIGVITNSSLIWRDDVRESLGNADWVSLKIDAVQERIWRQINRPHKALRLTSILEGMREFASTFSGKLVTETMLVNGLNENDACVREIADFLYGLRPHTAYLGVPTRPPASKWVRGPAEEALNRAYQILGDKLRHVEYLIGYEGNAFASTGDVENDILSITAVHPMREEAVNALLSRTGATWALVNRLVAQGDIIETKYEGHKFYLRRFKKSLDNLKSSSE
jgi:wyosine [tRNA(Phe)-imidazoG37] synthetase (radical SAM superfamily)